MSFRETREHGTRDFPMQVYQINCFHPRYEMVCHWHSEYELIRVTRGQMTVTLNEQSYLAREGDMFMVTAGALHSAVPDGNKCEYECIVFDISYFLGKDDACNRYIDDLLDYTVLLSEHIGVANPEVKEVADSLFLAMTRKDKGYKLAVKGLFYQLFSLFYKNRLYERKPVMNSRNKKRIATLKNVIFMIESSYDSQIKLKDMADAAAMSPGYFCAFFKEMTNKTPVEYLINYRIDQACRQLENSDFSVTEIAFHCGFNDLSHFIKTFKKLKNATPEKFRQIAYS